MFTTLQSRKNLAPFKETSLGVSFYNNLTLGSKKVNCKKTNLTEMKNNFELLKKSVSEHNNHAMDTIINLLESYNKGLSSYFSKREISRDFLETFDIALTLCEIKKVFDVNDSNQIAFSSLIMDLNQFARSTWYYETEDGKILTGEDLYSKKAVYLASRKEGKRLYLSEEDEKKAEELNDYIESMAFWGDDSEVPKPIGISSEIVNSPGYEKPLSIKEMTSAISFYAATLNRFLLQN